jgi:hypothetical protein
MLTTKLPTREEFALARQRLTNLGWKYEYSISREGDNPDFGSAFYKNDQVFYLNLHTIHNLPE